MSDKIPNISEMTWSFEPDDVFEEEFELERSGYSIAFERGKVTAIIDPTLYVRNKDIKKEIDDEVKSIFQGVEIFNHIKIKLGNYYLNVKYPDGSKEIISYFDTQVSVVAVSAPKDLIQKDQYGNIVYDSKYERIISRKYFFELSSKYYCTNSIVKSIIDSYKNAINDPSDELVHLYEIRDCLINVFGNAKNVQVELSITHKEWSHFGKLANDTPLKQGRHRGVNPGSIRNATSNELQEARKFSMKLINNYLLYLESKHQ